MIRTSQEPEPAIEPWSYAAWLEATARLDARYPLEPEPETGLDAR